MPTKIIDLDELAGEPKRALLAGKTYILPPDLPVELWLRLQRQAQQPEQSNAEAIEFLYAQLLELFRFGDPKIESLPIGMGQLIQAIGHIYGGDDEAGPERPTRPRASKGGTRSTSAKRRPTNRRS